MGSKAWRLVDGRLSSPIKVAYVYKSREAHTTQWDQACFLSRHIYLYFCRSYLQRKFTFSFSRTTYLAKLLDGTVKVGVNLGLSRLGLALEAGGSVLDEGSTEAVSVGLQGDELVVSDSGKTISGELGLLGHNSLKSSNDSGLEGLVDVVEDLLGIRLAGRASSLGIIVGGLEVLVELVGSVDNGDGVGSTAVVVVSGGLDLAVVSVDSLEIAEDLGGIAGADDGRGHSGGENEDAGDGNHFGYV